MRGLSEAAAEVDDWTGAHRLDLGTGHGFGDPGAILGTIAFLLSMLFGPSR